MKHLLLKFVLCIFCLTIIVILEQVANAESVKSMQTRYGVISISQDDTNYDNDKLLLFNGKPVKPVLQGNETLDLVEKYIVGNSDVILIQDTGGTACPATYYFATVTNSGIKLTKGFGTCSDLIVKKEMLGQKIILTMPGFVGPFDSEAAQRRAAKKRVKYVYENGVMTENGKPIK